MVDPARIFHWRLQEYKDGVVVYWMQRDQRVEGNWALLYAAERAEQLHQPLVVLFCLVPDFPQATPTHYRFMLNGLVQAEADLVEKGIPFLLAKGEPETVIPDLLDKLKAGLLVTDFNPLKITMQWKKKVAKAITVPFAEVDAHNILPARFITDKQEYSAFTLRKKIGKALSLFMTPVDPLRLNPEVADINRRWAAAETVFWNNDSIGWSPLVKGYVEQALLRTGYHAVSGDMKITFSVEKETLSQFLRERLEGYDSRRNDPNLEGQSGLSPYLHFGQISAQQVAWEVLQSDAPSPSKTAFLEELIVRRELSDNFCLHNPNYDLFEGFPPWAQRTLNIHRDDPREYQYNHDHFEQASTHDPLWNAAQREMVTTGKMHGYMRMYWAKKILEWTGSPEEAMAVAIFLNDRYSLDGRDPNGYAGIAWSIGGVHDRPWQERPVYGMIRYMNAAGCRRKFNVPRYVRRFS